MNPFLKKEWEDTEIPEQVYTRARHRAWGKLHQRPGRPWINFALAGATAALLIFFLMPEARVADEGVPEIVPVNPAEPVAVEPPREAPHAREEPEELPPPERANQIQPEPPIQNPQRPAEEDLPNRVVLNFQLPETGVRMIWIMDKDFEIGGTQ